MRILHTSDWHIGHSLHELSRDFEHRQFLAWLLDTLDEYQVDALLIAGDIFETANPSAVAQEIWFGFLANARGRCPKLDIVVVGGNHDSAARLDAPRPILAAHDVFMVGGLPRTADRELDMDRLLAPLHDADGKVKAWVAAVPYLRITDLPRLSDVEDPLIEGMRQIYAEVIAAARLRCDAGQALIATGHCYMTKSRISEMSERRILGGNQHALPVDVFPSDIAYVALGHLHLPQSIASDHVRYSGSPIPLSLGEREYPHQVLLVELDGARLASTTPLLVPRAVELLRVPERGALLLGDILPLLEALPDADDDPREEWPFLEIHVSLPAPEPTLRAEVEKAVEGRRVRLVRLHLTYTGTGAALGDHRESRRLDELKPEEVFLKCWHMNYEEEPNAEILESFHELVEQAERERA